jgi:hypothetical protein
MHERYAEDLAAYRAHFAPTHARLVEIEEMAPGPARMAALAALRTGPIDAAAAVRMLVLDEGDEAWLASQKMIDIHDAVNGHGYVPGTRDHDRVEMATHELAAALRITTADAAGRVDLTIAVAERLPQSWVALNCGDLGSVHVKAIHRSTEHCPARVAEAVDAVIVPLAISRRWTPTQIRKHARKIIVSIDPDGANDRAQKAKAFSDVEFYGDQDQMGTVRAHGDAATARRLYDTVNARAAQLGRDPGDSRTAGQRRFDALAEFVLGPRDSATADDGVTPAQQRARRHGEAQVRVDLTTLLGLDDNPGFLDGYGPITAQLARELAADASWRRWVTDPMTGELLDLGRSSYTPSAALRDFIEARDETCRMVGCERPARRCQLDHKAEWDRLGCTDCSNLQPLCQMHHQQKTKKRWTLTQGDDGDTWTSALGFTYRRNDDPYDIPTVDPPADYDFRSPAEPSRLVTDPDPPPSGVPLPDEPPLDPYETEELYDTLDNGWGEFATRAYNLLRAAQLIS